MVLFQQRNRRTRSTRYKSATGIQYSTLAIDPRSACPHRQTHTLPVLLDSRTALSNSLPNASVQCRETICTIFIMVFWYDTA